MLIFPELKTIAGIRGDADEEVCCINCHRSMFNRSCFSLLVQRKVVWKNSAAERIIPFWK